MDKWETLRYTIASTCKEISKQYLAEPTNTGKKADTARAMIMTLESIWRAMDKIEEKEKEVNDESNYDNGQPNT